MKVTTLSRRVEAMEKAVPQRDAEELREIVLASESLVFSLIECFLKRNEGGTVPEEVRPLLKAADEYRASWSRMSEEYSRRYHAVLQQRQNGATAKW